MPDNARLVLCIKSYKSGELLWRQVKTGRLLPILQQR